MEENSVLLPQRSSRRRRDYVWRATPSSPVKILRADIKARISPKGTGNGIPAVMRHVGRPSGWSIWCSITTAANGGLRGRSTSAAIYDAAAKKSLAAEDSKLVDILKAIACHPRFVSKPIGKSADNMYSYLALVQDDPTVQVVNNAQKAYGTLYSGRSGSGETAGAVAAAPFKVGGRKNDPAVLSKGS